MALVRRNSYSELRDPFALARNLLTWDPFGTPDRSAGGFAARGGARRGARDLDVRRLQSRLGLLGSRLAPVARARGPVGLEPGEEALVHVPAHLLARTHTHSLSLAHDMGI